jgi:two-component sensor histidine kinase
MHEATLATLDLSEAELAFLHTVETQMGIVADLSRADILLYGQLSPTEAIVLAHARPHSLAHVYTKSRVGRVVDRDRRPEVLQALIAGKRQKEHRSFIAEGAPVIRQALPVYFPPPWGPPSPSTNGQSQSKPRVIAALMIATNLIEYERHRLRSRVFRGVLKRLQLMLVNGRVAGAEQLSPFGEQDGIIYVDSEGIIHYASGIATNLYRRIGYKETLIGRRLSDLETGDEELRRTVLAQQRCLEVEREEAERVWVRKVIPLLPAPSPYWGWLKPFHRRKRVRETGVLILIHDETEIRRQNQELRIKNAMIQEVHHRVKNNLQTIAGLVRIQARRVKSEEARQVLDETLNRILSVAVIHEFLSNDSSNIINIKEISQRIISQVQQGMLDPDKQIQFELAGEPIYLPSRQATACSLIINELIQNAIEHGFAHKQEGLIRLNLEDSGDQVIIMVSDNGDGVPDNFKIEQSESLGLQIVKILVEGDLKGQLLSDKGTTEGTGLSIKIVFPKTSFKGEAGWNEHASL